MDPLSALSVASGVVAFVDFGGKLISRFSEIKNSANGQPMTIANLDESARDLSSVATEAKKKYQDLASHYPSLSESFARLHGECVEAETQLKSLLETVTAKVHSSKLRRLDSNARAAIRAMWSETEVKEWKEKLDRIRSQIMMNVLMCIWEDAKKARERTDSADGAGTLVEVVGRIETTMNALQDDFQKISAGRNLTDSSSAQARFDDALWASSGLLDLPDGRDQQPPPAITDKAAISKTILKSLAFEDMADRGERIATPYPNTFQWLFRDGDFTQWLKSDNEEPFWITGKPASGKSTLMKFISTHPDLESNLCQWTGDSQLHLATFFFWGPGSKIQKSRVGLLRSLLFQLLSQQPDLCDFVAPRRRVFFNLAGAHAASPEWQWPELRECLLRFAYKIQGKSRLALFIDGLDEYDGNHDELVAFLKQLHRDYNPKLCVSSRPWNVFADEFRHSPSLKMEELTKPDIDVYIQQHLGSNLAIQELRQLEPDSINDLMAEIRDKAEGVFLWVVLVVEQLLETARDCPSLLAIWKVFNALPRGLEELYDTILRTIEPSKREMASRLYQLVMEWKRTWNGQIQATFLWFAIDYVDPLQKMSYPEVKKEQLILPLITRLLAGHTKGILQISTDPSRPKSPTVDFLHRTAFDWLCTQGNWALICSQGPAGFQAIITIVASLVSHLRSLGPPSKDNAGSLELRQQCIFRILKVSGEIENTAENRARLLTILDQIEVEQLLPLDLDPMFRDTSISASDRTIPHGMAALAASWSCLPYLQAKCDASPFILQDKRRSILTRFSKEPAPVSVLEASILGGTSSPARSTGLCRFNEARSFTKWRTCQRLDTVRFLLERNVRPDSALKKSVKELAPKAVNVRRDRNEDERSFELEYWFLIASMFEYRSNLVATDREKRKLLPEVEEARRKEEFPDFEIDLQSRFHSASYVVDRWDLVR